MALSSTNNLLLRRPFENEWSQVMSLLKIANFENIGGKEMKKFDPEDCFVAIYKNKVVGVAGHDILDNKTAKTTLLVIAPEMRGQGIGIKLVLKRLEYLRNQGIEHLYTNCDDPKVMSWNCRHFGFRPTGKILPKLEPYGRPDKDSWSNFRLELNPGSTDMLPQVPVENNKDLLVYNFSKDQIDDELQKAVLPIIKMMRSSNHSESHPKTDADKNVKKYVSDARLNSILENEKWISDIVEDRKISNCLVYNFDNVDSAIINDKIARLRERLDKVVLEHAQKLFPGCPKLEIENTGHFWYPAGTYMGWHTNLRTPGWRYYINFVDQPNKSFFKYRDPNTGEIITSWDQIWNIRLFHITPAAPLWHAVYSNTNRFSFGYKVILN